MTDTATLTIHRFNDDITVALNRNRKGWKVAEAVDSSGQPTELTMSEQLMAVSRAKKGEDETGR